jgi:hypothetical protein
VLVPTGLVQSRVTGRVTKSIYLETSWYSSVCLHMCQYFVLVVTKLIAIILSHDRVATDGVRSGNWIY